MLKHLLITAICTALFSGSPVNVSAAEKNYVNREQSLDPNGLIIEDETSDAVGITVDYHTEKDIRKYATNYGPKYLKPYYTEKPDALNAPYSTGQLSEETLDDALKTVNMVRYIAGLNYNVELDTEYTKKVQAGALINAINGGSGKPEGMDDQLYQLGTEGNSNANQAEGYMSLAGAVTKGWLSDGDEQHIDTVSRREALLNAQLGKTGFGAVNSSFGMYVNDTSGKAEKTSNVWPAQNTPVEFFSADSPWSVSTGKVEDISKVRVSMSMKNTAYTFSQDSTNGYFNVDNNDGVAGTIIWRPENITYSPGDEYEISILGLIDGEISYTVTFFQLYKNEAMAVNPSSLEIGVGETVEIYPSYVPESGTNHVASLAVSESAKNAVTAEIAQESDTVFVTGIAEGSGTITLTSANGLTAVCNVNVVKKSIPASGITLSADTLNLEAGQSAQLGSEVTPANADDKSVVWTSSNDAVATVDANGLVTAVSEGTAVITAATVNGLTATCSVTVEKAPLTVSVYGCSLALEGKVGVNFYLNIPGEELNNLTVRMTMNGQTELVPASEADVIIREGAPRIKFVYELAAKELRDEIKLDVLDKDGNLVRLTDNGEDVTGNFKYSATTYFEKARKTTNEKLKTLVNALDTYGKYAQIYFGYNVTDEVLDAGDVSSVTGTVLAPYEAVRTGAETGLTYRGTSLLLESDTRIRIYFDLDGSMPISSYTFKMGNKTLEPAGSGTSYYVSITDIAAQDLGKMNTVTVTSGSETLTVNCGALSYAYTAVTSEKAKEPIKNVSKAIYLYNQAAVEYFN